MSRRVAVIGAGAAGTMAAIFSAAGGAETLLLERTRDGGRKILISGGGRCNILPARGRAPLRHRLLTPYPQEHSSLVASRGADRLFRGRAGADAGRGARDRQAVPGVEPLARRAGWVAGAGAPPRRALSGGDHDHIFRASGERVAGRAGACGAAGSGRGDCRDRRAVGAEHRERRRRAGDTRGARAYGASDMRSPHAGAGEPGTVRGARRRLVAGDDHRARFPAKCRQQRWVPLHPPWLQRAVGARRLSRPGALAPRGRRERPAPSAVDRSRRGGLESALTPDGTRTVGGVLGASSPTGLPTR